MEIEMKQGTSDWLEWRRNGVTATEASAIVGASKWATALSVYSSKTTANNGPSKPTAVQEWGSRIEDVIRTKFADEHPEFKVRPGNCFEREWRKASLDGTVTDSAGNRYILECKTGRVSADWISDDGKETVPDGYYAQVQWQMLVTGMRRVYFAVLLNGYEYFERVVEYDEQFAADMETKCGKFWDDLKAGVRPEPSQTHPEIDQPLLSEMARDSEKDGAFEVEPDVFERYRQARAEFDAATIRYGAVKAELTELLTMHDYLTHDGKKFASLVRMKPRESVDSAKLKAEFPQVYEAVKKIGNGTIYPKFG